MNDGSVKHDIEQVGRSTSQVSQRLAKTISRMLSKLMTRAIRFFNKRFSNSMNVLRKDGSTRELDVSPPITRDEMKKIVAKSKEAEVLIGVKEMSQDGEFGKRKSLYEQEKVAKHEINADKFKERSKTFRNVGFLKNYYEAKANKESTLAKQDSLTYSEKRYIIICNKSHTAFLNDRLKEIQSARIIQMEKNELNDINKDGVIDEKDLEQLTARSINMEPTDLNKEGEDYGTCMIRDYHANYCTQKVTKAEYCAMRESMWELSSHGAYTTPDGKIIVAFDRKELNEYLKYCPKTTIIKEYGRDGGTTIQSISNKDDIQYLRVDNEEQWRQVQEKYANKDVIASHNPDGSVSFLVQEKDTITLATVAQKKNTTEKLLEEAKTYIENEAKESMDSSVENLTKDMIDSANEQELEMEK